MPDWASQYNHDHPLAGTILLVEDDQTTIQTITSALQPLGCQIDIVHAGTKFLQQAHANSPHRILLNMQIPEMDGWQILSILKEDTTLQKIPVLCYTSLMITGDAQRFEDAGASAFLLKPFRIETLLEWLKSQQP
jgi:CheY-like chemotaxis protein